VVSDLEQAVIMGVMHVGDEAYGIPVHAEILERTGRDLSLAAVYKTLERLEQKGFLTKRVGEPTSERGGRRKHFYSVTSAGKSALRRELEGLRRMVQGLDVGLKPW
jgi:DNA-binding PadR family transcriptional regulator